MYEKDGQIFSERQVREAHPNVSFAASTFAELGYTEHIVAPPAETPEQTKARLSFAVSNRLNRKANEYRYDSIHTAINAKDSHVPKFAAEGAAFLFWWGETWAAVDLIEAQVQAGQRPIPTEAELLAELPALVI